MNDPISEEAIDAALEMMTAPHHWAVIKGTFRATDAERILAAAAPFIERQVRDKIAAEIEASALSDRAGRQRDAATDADEPCEFPDWECHASAAGVAFAVAARIARGVSA